jgi:hypothetical protein
VNDKFTEISKSIFKSLSTFRENAATADEVSLVSHQNDSFLLTEVGLPEILKDFFGSRKASFVNNTEHYDNSVRLVGAQVILDL